MNDLVYERFLTRDLGLIRFDDDPAATIVEPQQPKQRLPPQAAHNRHRITVAVDAERRGKDEVREIGDSRLGQNAFHLHHPSGKRL